MTRSCWFYLQAFLHKNTKINQVGEILELEFIVPFGYKKRRRGAEKEMNDFPQLCFLNS